MTVLHLPHKVDDNAVLFVLKRHGKVLGGRYITYKEYPDIFNGIRQYKMEVTMEIPSLISLGGCACWVRYEGQPHTCLNCGKTGHIVKDCWVVWCFRCRKEGHVLVPLHVGCTDGGPG